MPYCIPEDVTDMIATDVTPARIGHLIQVNDDELDDRLDGSPMSTGVKTRVSMYMTAIQLAQKFPKSLRMPGSNITYGDRVVEWQVYVDNAFRRAKYGMETG